MLLHCFSQWTVSCLQFYVIVCLSTLYNMHRLLTGCNWWLRVAAGLLHCQAQSSSHTLLESWPDLPAAPRLFHLHGWALSGSRAPPMELVSEQLPGSAAGQACQWLPDYVTAAATTTVAASAGSFSSPSKVSALSVHAQKTLYWMQEKLNSSIIFNF